MQAQAALLSKPQLPEKVMESVLIRFEQASSRKLPVTIATPRTALIAPLMGMVIEPPVVHAIASVVEVQGTSAAEGIANGWKILPGGS